MTPAQFRPSLALDQYRSGEAKGRTAQAPRNRAAAPADGTTTGSTLDLLRLSQMPRV